ncbi:MAG: hypothetical protein JRJ12_11725 [Deltaproteobacteria bacterium]|nr:hypothetical protein [Deltaproteobacteria bacterium]
MLCDGRITIGFSSHRVEVLPFAEKEMSLHELIILEEPESEGFEAMLAGRLSLDDYLLQLDSAFPEFESRLCHILRKLHRRGCRIIQVEPYLDTLLHIHELFAEGKTKEDVLQQAELREVYLAEREATAALISYYTSSLRASFAQVVAGVKKFAQADARRLELRQRLRARSIASELSIRHSTYVEAGYIHYPLYRYLRSELGQRTKVKVVFLLTPVIKKLGAISDPETCSPCTTFSEKG